MCSPLANRHWSLALVWLCRWPADWVQNHTYRVWDKEKNWFRKQEIRKTRPGLKRTLPQPFYACTAHVHASCVLFQQPISVSPIHHVGNIICVVKPQKTLYTHMYMYMYVLNLVIRIGLVRVHVATPFLQYKTLSYWKYVWKQQALVCNGKIGYFIQVWIAEVLISRQTYEFPW